MIDDPSITFIPSQCTGNHQFLNLKLEKEIVDKYREDCKKFREICASHHEFHFEQKHVRDCTKILEPTVVQNVFEYNKQETYIGEVNIAQSRTLAPKSKLVVSCHYKLNAVQDFGMTLGIAKNAKKSTKQQFYQRHTYGFKLGVNECKKFH